MPGQSEILAIIEEDIYFKRFFSPVTLKAKYARDSETFDVELNAAHPNFLIFARCLYTKPRAHIFDQSPWSSKFYSIFFPGTGVMKLVGDCCCVLEVTSEGTLNLLPNPGEERLPFGGFNQVKDDLLPYQCQTEIQFKDGQLVMGVKSELIETSRPWCALS